MSMTPSLASKLWSWQAAHFHLDDISDYIYNLNYQLVVFNSLQKCYNFLMSQYKESELIKDFHSQNRLIWMLNFDIKVANVKCILFMVYKCEMYIVYGI